MKRTRVYLAVSAVMIMAACSKEKEQQQGITESQAAEVVSASVSKDYGGLSWELRSLTQRLVFPTKKNGTEAVTVFALCDTTITDTIQHSASGLNISWDFYLDYANSYVCNPSQDLQTVQLVTNKSGNYTGPHLSSAYQCNADWSVSNLEPGLTDVLFNGKLHRNGDHTLTDDNGNSFSAKGSIDLDVNNVSVTRFLGMTQSGTANLVLTGSNSNGVSYNYVGSIQFLGNHKATLTINGNTYNITVW
ncbi:MAG: hypothetical protein KDD36_00040 [Flavobacteriales bacterium]|nr:hypothetical protein [Flavobacteriales bacterium]